MDMFQKTGETELNQVDNGGGGAWEYLCLVRKLKIRRSEKVLKHSSCILNDPGSDLLSVQMNCVKVLRKKFPESKRIGRLEALLLEAKGLYGEAEEAYSSLLEDNPLDQAIHKRRVAIIKALGKPSLAIELLSKYLELKKMRRKRRINKKSLKNVLKWTESVRRLWEKVPNSLLGSWLLIQAPAELV